MNQRAYPRQVWVLLPSFKPKEVTITAKYDSYTKDYGDVTEAGKRYAVEDMFPTAQVAIAAGRALLQKQQDALNERGRTIYKKHEALNKADKELTT